MELFVTRKDIEADGMGSGWRNRDAAAHQFAGYVASEYRRDLDRLLRDGVIAGYRVCVAAASVGPQVVVVVCVSDGGGDAAVAAVGRASAALTSDARLWSNWLSTEPSA